MNIEATQHAQEPYAGFGLTKVQEAHRLVNGAINIVSGEQTVPLTLADISATVALTKDAKQCLEQILGHDGPDSARTAAHAVMPRIARAIELLEALGQVPDPSVVGPLADELNVALDHLEETLGAADWE